MESLAETKKRKTGEGNSSSSWRKKRSSGTNTVQFLREKMENDNKLEKQELELRKAVQEQQTDMLTQMQTMQMSFMEQQQTANSKLKQKPLWVC